MATASRPDDDRFQPEVPERKRSTMQTCLIGCLIIFVVLLVLGALAGYWVWNNGRAWLATGGAHLMRQAIDQSELPPQEKQDINVQIDRIAQAFRTGQLSVEKLAEIIQKLADSPLMTAIVASAVEAKYLAKSGLSDDEKAQAVQTLRRFLRGVVDKKIDEDTVNTAMAYVSVREPDGSWTLREHVSDEDLRKFFESAKAAADKAEIPDEPEVFDPSEEMKLIVDEVLKP
jgi:hypothetical protein